MKKIKHHTVSVVDVKLSFVCIMVNTPGHPRTICKVSLDLS
jgi:hypothetical protein